MMVVAALVRLRMGSPVLFRHQRTGQNGKSFVMLKFRTMDLAVVGETRSSSERITKLGLRLRRSSLDELPQLINVLRGDMSLVGPRPLPTSYDALYSEGQKRRFEAKPGLTGLAQVNGRSHLAWTEKFAYDVAYVDDVRLRSDMQIIFMTARRLFDRSSDVADGARVQERFDGTN